MKERSSSPAIAPHRRLTPTVTHWGNFIVETLDDELVAVLAHEVGHLKQRHALRHVLQGSVTALLIVVITGDVNSILGAVPLAVIGARYSRAFEREADDFALHYLASQRIDPVIFSDILLRLEQQHPQGHFPSFLASHPAAAERARRARESQGK